MVTVAAAPEGTTQPPTPAANSNNNDDSMPEEQPDVSSQRSSPGRTSKRIRLTPGPGKPVEGEAALVPPLKNVKRPTFKSYGCPACEATNMSGQMLREHFLAEHKEVAAAANNIAITGNTNSTENKSTGNWNDTERQKFVAGCIIFGWGKWSALATLVSTRDKHQIKSHAQKFQLHRPKEYQELMAYHNGDELSDNCSTKSNVSGNDSVTSSNAGGTLWTEDEQEQFKMGVIINGWGSWNEIAKNVPTKTTTQVRSRALNIQRYRQDEEARLKAEHAKLVARNPQLFSTDYVRQVTGAATAEKSTDVAGCSEKKHHEVVTCFPLPAKTKSPKSTTSNQDSVKSPKSDGYAGGTWTKAEHNQFEQAVIQYGWGDWVSITQKIPTRDKKQVKSHAQKFDIHHPGGRDRLQKEHQKARMKKLKKGVNVKRKKFDKEEKTADVEKKRMEEANTADAAMDVEENADVTFEEEKIDENDDDQMEVEALDENEQEKQRAEEGGKSTEEGERGDGREEADEEASTSFSDESRQQQQLRVSPRVVKAPRDNYMDSLQKDQWQRKNKVSKYRYPKGQAFNNSMSTNFGGIRKRNDDSHEVRIWYAGRWWNIGSFESEELAEIAHRIASGILQPENTPSDPAAVEWNIKIARDAAIDGVKLAERDAEGGGEGGVGLLEPPKAIQNYLLGGHMVSAGEQTIKHRLFSTATATKTETNLAHFTVTCSNGPIHVDVAINDSLFDLRRKIFDQFDSSQLDDGDCNFNFQVDTNMISRKVEDSFIARDLLQLGKSVELIPRSAVLTGESSQDVHIENHDELIEEEEDDEDEDLTSFYEAAASENSSKLKNLVSEIATVTPPVPLASTGPKRDQHPTKVVEFLKTLAGKIDYSDFNELVHVNMMEKTGIHEKQVNKWISNAKKRFVQPMMGMTQPEATAGLPKVDSLNMSAKSAAD